MENSERLWAPWRLEYVTGAEAALVPPEPDAWLDEADRGCFLCRAGSEFGKSSDADRQQLVVARDERVLVMLNRYPYNNGHLLVAPRRHAAELANLVPEEHLACMEWLARLTQVFRALIRPDGFNIGLNLGRAAGAGLPGHLHWHLVPRWSGDTNFMSSLAGTRVIPQSLEAMWELLSEALRKS
ncbi:MAG TPA: HIT domain-containing protein [Lacipirellulaceae bacterium]|jgi:ATP adenylyltransferase